MLRADLQPAHPVLPLFGIGGCGKRKKKQVSKTLLRSLQDDLTQHRFPYASASPAADNGKHPDQYCMNLMDGGGGRPRAEKQREGVEKPASVLGHLPLSLYCSPLMALTVKVCESSSLGEMTAPARGSIPRGFWGRDCSLTKYSRKPASLFKTKNLQGTTAATVTVSLLQTNMALLELD